VRACAWQSEDDEYYLEEHYHDDDEYYHDKHYLDEHDNEVEALPEEGTPPGQWLDEHVPHSRISEEQAKRAWLASVDELWHRRTVRR
jgi:hypothetical protein